MNRIDRRRLAHLSILALLATAPVLAVERISVSTGGGQGNVQSRYPAISADGRFVTFESDASNLAAGDSNAATDIFVRDRLLATTTRISLTSAGGQGNAASQRPAISGDGSRIVFTSFAGLLPDSGFQNCYLLDRSSGALAIIDRQASGVPASDVCQPPTISLDGNAVAFASRSGNLLPFGQDTNGWADAFVRTVDTGALVRVNLGGSGVQANADVGEPRISAFGSHVIFASNASNLIAGDSNGARDVFVSDLSGLTRRISVGSGNSQANGVVVPEAALNADASLVAFSANASSLPGWNVNVESVLYLRLPGSDLTVPVSIPAAGSHDGSAEQPDFSATGRWLVFWANDQLISGVTVASIYVVDLLEDTIALVSQQPDGQPAGAGNHFSPRISADGRGIVWFSNSALLVAGDTNGTWDVFYADNPLWDDTVFADGFESD